MTLTQNWKNSYVITTICKIKDVSKVRFMKYHSKYQNENKIVDISSLPSCQSVLSHSKRGNYVACIWKRYSEASFKLERV